MRIADNTIEVLVMVTMCNRKMLVHNHPRKRRHNADQDKPSDADGTTKLLRRESPPFLIHYQNTDKVKYKLGDKNNHNGTTFFFCDCPLYHNKLK